jgi:hypothetical protein
LAEISSTDGGDGLEHPEDQLAERHAIETYEAWQRDPSGAVPWEEFEAELIADGRLDPGDVAEPRPSTV